MTPLHVDGVWKPNGSSKLTMHVKFFVAIFNSFFTLKPPNPRDPGSPNLEVHPLKVRKGSLGNFRRSNHHQEFQVAKNGGILVTLFSVILGVGKLPYISRIHTAYILVRIPSFQVPTKCWVI